MRAAVARSAAALSSLRADVAADTHSYSHSALQAGALSILDVYSNAASEVDVSSDVARAEEEERQQAGGRCGRRLAARCVHFTSAPATWVYLILLGVFVALSAFAVDAPVTALLHQRAAWLDSMSAGAGYFFWVAWSVTLASCAAGVGHFVPMTQGSGIPQMKSVLAGTTLQNYLSLRVGVAKGVGLIAALASGLPLGKEGPLVHIASVLASKLWRLPYFRRVIGDNDTLRRQMLAAAVAAGVTGVFGTPVGGVLFSVEVTSTYFLTSSYWRCFLCAIVCRFMFDLITALKADTLLEFTTFPVSNFSAEVLAYMALAVLCGCLASAFVFLENKVRIARNILMTTPARRYALVAGVAALVASLNYSAAFLRKSDKDALNELFSTAAASEARMADWAESNIVLALSIFLLLKFGTTLLALALPIPCGLFMPLFIMGAATGRLFGEVMHAALPSVMPGTYALVGAACLVSGATQTVSTAVIIFEATGQTANLLPVLLGVLIAYSVSGLFTISIYDMLMIHARLPFLPRVLAAATYQHATAADVMRTRPPVLTLDSTYDDARRLLSTVALVDGGAQAGGAFASQLSDFALVRSAAHPHLLGSVRRSDLEAVFARARAVAAASPRARRPPTPQAAAHTPRPSLEARAEAVAAASATANTPTAATPPLREVGMHAQEEEEEEVGGGGTARAYQPLSTPIRERGSAQAGDSGAPSLTARTDRLLTRWLVAPDADAAQRAEAARLSPDARAELGMPPPPPPEAEERLPLAPPPPHDGGTSWLARRLRALRRVVADNLSGPVFSRDSAEAQFGALREEVEQLDEARGFAALQPRATLRAARYDAAWLQRRVHFVGVARGALGDADAWSGVRVDAAPLQLMEATPLAKVHYLFAICLFSSIFVTAHGQLAGIILKDDLSMGAHNAPTRRRRRSTAASGVGMGAAAGEDDARSEMTQPLRTDDSDV